MSPTMRGILAGVMLAVGLTMAWSPAIAALQPKDHVRLPYPTADLLDMGPRCVYVWDQEIHVWIKPSTNIPCLAKPTARATWQEAEAALDHAAKLQSQWANLTEEGR